MAGDLGKRDEIDAATVVLNFWFGEVSPDKRFTKDTALDRTIGERFGALRDAVLANDAQGWRDTPDRLLAAIVMLDQFSRNLHRGSAEAFAADRLTLSLTHEALRRGWEKCFTAEQLQFLYLPLMHAEDAAAQALSVEKYEALGDPAALAAARDHQDVLLRYGRFPSRNLSLGRRSTQAEETYLNRPRADW